MLHQQPLAAGKPKILIFLHSFEPGGVERVALRLAGAWQASGANVSMLIGRPDGELSACAAGLNPIVYRSAFLPIKRFETLWMILCLCRNVRQSPPDVIFCAGNTYTVVAAALRLLLGSKCPPIVCKVSNALRRPDLPAPLREAYELWLRAQRHLAVTWVAMADSLKDEIVSFIGVRADQVAVVDDPAISLAEARCLETERTSRSASRSKGRLFVAVGRLVRQKRFDLLVRAFSKGAQDGDRLIILGEGPKRGSLQRLIRKSGVGGRIRMVGHCGDIGPWLGRADCLVLASDYEGVPAVVVEALACGIPVLATRCSPWLEETLASSRFGGLVGCGDEAALASAIAGFTNADFPLNDARALAALHSVERGAAAYLSIMVDAAARYRAEVRHEAPWAIAGDALRQITAISAEPALESERC